LTTGLPAATGDLPPNVGRVLSEFVEDVRGAFGGELRAIVLYGSAAEGRLRPTSDVNVVVVLSSFEQAAVDRIREGLRVAQAAVRLAPMFLLEDEIPGAAEAFAAKFTDIRQRRRVLYGSDPFASLVIPRGAAIARLRQVLLNLALRLRALYAQRSLREEQLTLVIADTAGPLRASAETLLELEGHAAPSAKEALARVAASLQADGFRESLARVSEARETGRLPPGIAGPTLFRLIALAQGMRKRAEGLS
jgi:predicted nucleotidyltransferase